MNENIDNVENLPNKEPSLQEILDFLDKLPNGGDYKEGATTEKENGCDVEFISESSPDRYVCSVRPDGKTAMDIVYYDGEDIVGGEHLGTYEDGVWKAV